MSVALLNPRSDLGARLANLARAVERGDAGAAGELYSESWPLLLAYFSGRLRSHEAEDLASQTIDVALDALRRGSVRDTEQFAAYLWGVGKNLLTGAWRRSERRVDLDEKNWEQLRTSTLDPEGALLSAERSAALDMVLKKLTEEEREILRRFYLQEQSGEAIRAAMGLTEARYRNLKWRAKAKCSSVYNSGSKRSALIRATACATGERIAALA